MRHAHRVVALAVTQLLAAAMTTAPTSSASRDTTCQEPWRRVETPFDQTPTTLFDIDRTPDGTPMVMGVNNRVYRQHSRFMVLRDGHWTAAAMPSVGESDVLFALAVRTRQDAWAVGHYVASGDHPLTAHWNGRRWSTVGTPLSGAEAMLTDVALAGRRGALAVGYALGKSGRRPVALRWTGGSWHDMSPVAVRGDVSLTSIDVVSANDAWAAGTIRWRAVNRPYLAHWNGHRWVRSQPVGIPSGEAVLTDVVMARHGAGWAVGYRLAGGRMRPLLLAWNGTTWRSTRAPAGIGPALLLRGVGLSPSGQLSVVGTGWQDGRYRSLMFERVGGAWTGAGFGTPGTELYSVDTQPTPELAVGAANRLPLVLGRCVGSSDATGPQRNRPAQGHSPAAPAAGDEDRREGSLPGVPQARLLPKPINLADLEFRDIARDVGLVAVTPTYGTVTADFDSNGWPDVFLGAHAGVARLWLNVARQGHRVFVPASAGVPTADRHGCSAGDVNGDGVPELACAIGAHHGQSVKPDEIWFDVIQAPSNRALDLGIVDPTARGRRAQFIDADDDGRLDLFMTNEPSRVDGLPSQNRLYLNRWPHGFVASTPTWMNPVMGGGCLVASDLDRDGRQDLLICGRREASGGLHVYRNRPGGFEDVTSRWGITPMGDQDVAVVDLNGDGRRDLVQVSRSRLRVSENLGRRFAVRWEASLVRGASVAAGDITGDGRPDLYIVQAGERARTDVLLVGERGWRFRSVRIPQAAAGSGEDVTAFDYNRDGRMEFLVANGDGSGGPLELITAFPPSKDAQ